MASSSRVAAYFSDAAAQYQRASSRSLWRLVRDREARAVTALLGDFAGREVLELGCGAGFYTRLLLAGGARHVVAVDFSQSMLDHLPSGAVTAICADATTVDPGRRFEVLLSAGMLEFVPDALAALRNAARLAEPGAPLVILVPTDSLLGRGYRRFHRGNGMNIRLFDKASVAALAAASGWTVSSYTKAGPYSAVARLTRDAEER